MQEGKQRFRGGSVVCFRVGWCLWGLQWCACNYVCYFGEFGEEEDERDEAMQEG